jgi:hypothetical protein
MVVAMTQRSQRTQELLDSHPDSTAGTDPRAKSVNGVGICMAWSIQALKMDCRVVASQAPNVARVVNSIEENN